MPCTWSHVLGPLVCRLGRAGTPCSSPQGAHGAVTWASPSAGLASLCAHPRPQTSAFQLVVVPATSQHCSLPLFIFQPLNRRQRLAATQTLNNQTCCVGPAAALASFACPLAPSNSLSSSAAASGLDRVPPTRAAHGRPLVGRDRSPPRQSQPPRVFCPVPTCPCSDPARGGWATVATMKSHINAHLAGSLQGDVPIAWLHCLVCGLNFSQARGVHPTCRPEARAAAVDAAIPMDTDGLQLPSLSAIQPPRLPCGIPLAMLGLRS